MAQHNKSDLILTLQQLLDHSISFQEAALITGYTTVHLRSLVKRFSVYGEACLINGHRGQIPANKKPASLKKQIVAAYKKDFQGFNFKFFLEEYRRNNPSVKLSYTTLQSILQDAGIESPEKRRVKRAPVHRPRARKQHEGELLQIDATPYAWFDWCGDKTNYALHGSIDDATGKLTALTMCENECLYGYLDLVRQTFFTQGFGHPYSIYSDRAAIFCYTPRSRNGLASMPEPLLEDQLKETRTQWQRAMKELNVKQVLAFSPQAKGRIERLWKTLQGRLPYYFKKLKIKTIDAANKFLQGYIKEFNAMFAVEPASKIKVWHSTGKNPDYILSARFMRQCNSAGVFSFHNCKWRIQKPGMEGRKIEVCVTSKWIKVYDKGNFYNVELVEQRTGVSSSVIQDLIYKYLYTDCKKKSI